MTRRLILVLLLLTAAAGAFFLRPWLTSAPQSPPVPDLRAFDPHRLRVITCNIRFADPTDKATGNDWPHRQDLLIKTLLVHEPDLIGFQEATPAQRIHIQRGLPDFTFVTIGDGEDFTTGALSGLDSLAFRKDRFTLLSSAAGFIRPDSLQQPLTENAFYTLALLHDTHAVFPDILFLNTHIRHDINNAIACTTRLRGILAAQLATHPGAAIIVTGDMNHDRTDPSYAALLSPKTPGPPLADTFDYSAKNPAEHWGTYHAFGGNPVADLPSDLIFTAGLSATPAIILKDHSDDNHYPSDHFFVSCDLHPTKP